MIDVKKGRRRGYRREHARQIVDAERGNESAKHSDGFCWAKA